jgi:hypothetical protein
MRSLWVLVAALACLAPGAARAQRGYDRLVLDRVDLEPASLHGLARLRMLVAPIALQKGGEILSVTGDRAWRLKVGSSDKKVPYVVGQYAGTQLDTAIVVVVATSGEMGPELDAAKRALLAQLVPVLRPGKPPDTGPITQVSVLGYSSEPDDGGKLGSVDDAAEDLEALSLERATPAPDLIEALETALSVLRKAKTRPDGRPLRKMIILVSDGRTAEADRDTVSDLGERAGRAGVRIHSLAFVPASGSKGTLLNLGELSRKSLGTFRWVRLGGDTGWRQPVANLVAEIQRQYVVTFFVPAEEVVGRQVSLTAQVGQLELTSNRLRVTRLACGRVECAGDGYCVSGVCVVRQEDDGWGVLGWLLAIGGAAVGLGGLALGARALLHARHRRHVAAPAVAPPAGAPAGPVSAGLPAVPGRIAPIGGPAGGPVSAAHAAVPQQPAVAAQPVLFVLSGPRTGQRIPIHNGFTIGKAPGSHLMLDQDGFASSSHAMITVDARGTCTLVDRGSTNGTFANGIRVTQVVLTHGMAVRVGSTELRFLTQ